MAKLLFIFGAFLCLQLASCRVARDTQAQAPDFQQLLQQAETAIGELNTKFLEVVGVKNNDELLAKAQNQAKEYAEKVQGIADQLKSQAGKADEAIQTVAARLGKAMEEWKSQTEQNPTVQKLQEDFQTKLQSVMKATEEYKSKVEEHGKFVSADVEKMLKEIYDNTVQTAQKVAQDVDAAIHKKD